MKLKFFLSLIFVFMTSFALASEEVDAVTTSPEQVTTATATATPAAEKSEEQIPVNFTKEKKAEAAETSNTRMFLTFGLMAILLGVGYFFAKKYGRPSNSPHTKIKVLTQHYLGPKKSLAIVRVAGESILIGVTDQNISMIKSLSLLDDEIPESIPGSSFQETLNVNEKKEMSVEPNQAASTQTAGGEEFSIRHIKDVVSLKLKGMRSEV